MAELKPCPFCGNYDLEFMNISGFGNDAILCPKCLAVFSQMEITCEDDLKRAWNRRAGEDG